VERAISADPELPATILRLPMVYGPEDPLHRLYPVVKRMHDKRPVILHEQSFAQCVPCRGYVENMAHAIAVAATSERAAGRVYNVADPDPYTEAEWAAKIGEVVSWQFCMRASPPARWSASTRSTFAWGSRAIVSLRALSQALPVTSFSSLSTCCRNCSATSRIVRRWEP
jgi:nucleoside-diphosphate-sugar epimerase